jgi:two-component system phosphate regulon response regulator PhoB
MMKKNVKLLVVDDNTQIRNLIRMSFKRQLNIEVFEAENGLDGFKQFQTINPDIVLSDVMMPGEIDGIRLCEQIKASDHSCRVVLMSGKGQQSDIDLGLQAGADYYKVKPFSPVDLIDIVQRLVG